MNRMDGLIRKLSEIRSEYNCFDEGEESYYWALSEAIRFLSRRADGDTISRRAAIDALMVWEEESIWDEECLKHRGEPFLVSPSDVIEKLPSAQPECENGKWIEEDYVTKRKFRCSKCGEYTRGTYISKFCPNCGARMRGNPDG